MVLARVAGAQDSREVVIRLYRAGDVTASVRGATVTIDHSIEAGNTDSAGIVRIPIDDAMRLTVERGLPARGKP